MYSMRHYADLGVCYPPRPNTLLDLYNSSDDTQCHPITSKEYEIIVADSRTILGVSAETKLF